MEPQSKLEMIVLPIVAAAVRILVPPEAGPSIPPASRAFRWVLLPVRLLLGAGELDPAKFADGIGYAPSSRLACHVVWESAPSEYSVLLGTTAQSE